MSLLEQYRETVLQLYSEYNNFTEYPPNTDGRIRVRLFNSETKTEKITQRARIVLEVKLNRRLKEDETVDHVDENPTNDCFDNLQCLSRSSNSRRSVKRRSPVIANCVGCGNLFELTRHQVTTRAKKTYGPFCSKTCSGKYSRGVQIKKHCARKRREIVVEYHKLSDRDEIGST